MTIQEYGPLRSRVSRKPWPTCPDAKFYACPHCGGQFQALSNADASPACCGSPMLLLQPRPVPPPVVGADVLLTYKVVGGFNQNAVQIEWGRERVAPRWVVLQTFTGGYLKHVSAQKKPPMVFPLSDEDAYVYCDRTVCQQCVFRCKSGFVLYAYFDEDGLYELPLDKMAEYFER